MQFERSSTEPRLPDEAHRAFSHWPTSFTGAFVALTVLLILCLLGLGVGMTSWNAAESAGGGGLPPGFGRNAGVWFAVSMFIAFALGGYYAAEHEFARDPEYGAWQGAPVVLAASPALTLLLLGTMFIAVTGLAGMVAGSGGVAPGGPRVDPATVGNMASNLRDFSWGILAGLVLALAGSALAGMLAGSRSRTASRGVRRERVRA
jgi:hypothetical protein